MDKSEFLTIMQAIEHGTGKPWQSKEQVGVWYECLKDLDPNALKVATVQYLMTGDDWPSIAKLRRLATAVVHGEPLDQGEAFDLMISAVRKHGWYAESAAKGELDPLVWRTVQGLGGWQVVCDSPTDERGTLRAQFRMIYDSLSSRDRRHQSLPEGLRPRIGSGDVDPAVKRLADSLPKIGEDP